MFDTDKFIELIHEKQALWDKRCKEYGDKNFPEKAWFDVGSGMFENWMELDSSVRNEKVNEMKNKWRHIRDRYMKSMNQARSGDSAKKRRKYVYAEALAFLQQGIERRETSGNFEKSDTEEEEENVKEANESIEKEASTSSFEISSKELEKEQPKRGRVKSLTLFQNKLLEKLDSSQEEANDPDKAFLISLLPHVKSLNEDEKIEFQVATFNFLREIKRRKKFNSSQHFYGPSNYFPASMPLSINPYFDHSLPVNPPSINIPLPPQSPCTTSHQNLPPVSPAESHLSSDSFQSQSPYSII